MGGCAETERWVAEAERCVSVRWMAEAERWVVDTVRWEAEAERWVAVLRQGDGWLSQRDLCHSEMDGRGRETVDCAEAERWVAEAERCVSQ